VRRRERAKLRRTLGDDFMTAISIGDKVWNRVVPATGVQWAEAFVGKL